MSTRNMTAVEFVDYARRTYTDLAGGEFAGCRDDLLIACAHVDALRTTVRLVRQQCDKLRKEVRRLETRVAMQDVYIRNRDERIAKLIADRNEMREKLRLTTHARDELHKERDKARDALNAIAEINYRHEFGK